MAVASHGKKLDNEAERKAETDPGRLVTPQELNELAGFVGNQEEKQSTSFEDTETERTDQPHHRKRPSIVNYRPSRINTIEEKKEEAKVQ